MTVYKYSFSVPGTELLMPAGAELLTVQRQDEALCLWARVDPARPMARRLIRVVGTGWPDAEGAYVGTVQEDWLVWHVFDGGEALPAPRPEEQP